MILATTELQYERAVRDYETTHQEPALWESLLALGYDYAEVQLNVDAPRLSAASGVCRRLLEH